MPSIYRPAAEVQQHGGASDHAGIPQRCQSHRLGLMPFSPQPQASGPKCHCLACCSTLSTLADPCLSIDLRFSDQGLGLRSLQSLTACKSPERQAYDRWCTSLVCLLLALLHPAAQGLTLEPRLRSFRSTSRSPVFYHSTTSRLLVCRSSFLDRRLVELLTCRRSRCAACLLLPSLFGALWQPRS